MQFHSKSPGVIAIAVLCISLLYSSSLHAAPIVEVRVDNKYALDVKITATGIDANHLHPSFEVDLIYWEVNVLLIREMLSGGITQDKFQIGIGHKYKDDFLYDRKQIYPWNPIAANPPRAQTLYQITRFTELKWSRPHELSGIDFYSVKLATIAEEPLPPPIIFGNLKLQPSNYKEWMMVVNVRHVPEPSTIYLTLIGMIGMASVAWTRHRRNWNR